MTPSALVRGAAGRDPPAHGPPQHAPPPIAAPLNPLTACGGGVAVAADDELDFSSGVSDIARQHMAWCH